MLLHVGTHFARTPLEEYLRISLATIRDGCKENRNPAVIRGDPRVRDRDKRVRVRFLADEGCGDFFDKGSGAIVTIKVETFGHTTML
jgi:hypothetical protein